MSYPDIEAFLAVAREGQLARAAEQLGTSVTTLHRRIATLEAAIGTGLFVRSSGGHRLSEAGERLLASANGVEAAMGGFRRAAAAVRTTPEGKVRIAAPEMIVLHLLAPRVAALREAAPRIVPEFMSSPDRARLAERQADMAVRLSDPGEASLVARRTGSIRFGLYAPDAAVAVQQAERTADGWLPVSWVGWNDALTGLPVARCSAGLLPPEPRRARRTRFRSSLNWPVHSARRLCCRTSSRGEKRTCVALRLPRAPCSNCRSGWW